MDGPAGCSFLVAYEETRLIPLGPAGRGGWHVSREVFSPAANAFLSPAQLSALPPRDIAKIALWTIGQAVSRSRARGPDKAEPILLVPVSYRTLTSQGWRAGLIDAYRGLSEACGRAVIAEIRDTAGVPDSVLKAAVAEIRACSHSVVSHLEEWWHGLAGPQTGMDGFTFDLHGAVAPERAQTARTLRIGAQQPDQVVVALGANDTVDLAAAIALGATHAGLKAERSGL